MTTSRPERRRTRLSVAIVSFAIASMAVGACSATPQSQATSAAATATPTVASVAPATPQPTVAVTPEPTPTPPPTASPTPAPSVVALDATLYFMGFDITPSQVTYDPVAATVRIDATFLNRGSAQTDLLYIPDGGKATLAWSGPAINLGMDSSNSTAIPGGATVKGTFTASVPEGFVLADSVLTLGLSDQHQSTLPLKAGATATTEMPRDFAVTGSVKVGNMAKVTFKRGQVVAATCSGDPDKISFAPAKKGEESILLNVVSQGINSSWDTIVYSAATGPDGISATGTPGGRYMGALSTFRTDVLCYTVTAPAKGTYVTKWTAERTTKKGTFTFVVP